MHYIHNGADSLILDSVYCAAVVDQCVTEDCVKLKYPDGQLLPVCSSTWNVSLNSQICTYLYKGKAGSVGATQAPSSASQFLKLTDISSSSFIDRFTKVNNCPGSQVLKISCEDVVCGRRKPSLSPFIIGGTETTQQGRWPWQVELKFRGLHICGATLLSPHWILTAAHCVSKGREQSPELLSVTLGTTQVPPGQKGSLKLDVKRVVKHYKFVNVYGGYDAALLYVEQQINYTDIIKPACLPSSEDVLSSRSRCYLTGWGKTNVPSEWPDKLHEAKYKIMSTDVCNSSWTNPIQDNMICAGYKSGTIRSCHGDSGGPLVCLDKYKRWTIAGITSFGPEGCLLANQKPDVFTRVTSFTKWINDIIHFEFTCNNGRKIKDSDILCDGADDCGDNSDEIVPCSRTVACSFESRSLCGYTVGKWRPASGLASLTGSVLNTGPSFDHSSGLADRSHKYMVTSLNGAVLTSPLHNETSEETCLQLYYYLSYDSKLSIYKTSTSGHLLTTVRGAADHWQAAQVTLPAGSYPLVFRAGIYKLSSYVAVDDVKVIPGACPAPCPSGTFKCRTDIACIPSGHVCDGVSHCADSSDESGCNPIKEVKCSFDEPFGCGFRQSNDDTFNWNFRYGSSGSSPGPSGGHMDGDERSDEAYLIAVAPVSHAKATITWPLKLPTAACMTFWYYMYGTDVGSMAVVSDGVTLWQEFGSQGNRWHRARVLVQAGKMVNITTQSGVKNSYVAVDDVVIVAGGCPAAPACAPATQIQCLGKCLNATAKCDRTLDCFDMSDESGCNWNVNCNFDSACPSYVITAAFGTYIWRKSNAGNYLSADAATADRGSRTSYTSAPLALTATQCLTFKYRLYASQSGNSELRVTLTEPTISRKVTLWRMSSSRSTWTEAHVTVSPTDQIPVTLAFHALYGGLKTRVVALDDVRLSPGACSAPACPGQFLCPYEETCIPTTARCNGVRDCHGGFDEQGCGDLAKSLDCTFDDDICRWTRPASSLLLERNAGSTPRVNTGPAYDHTERNLLGSYLYLKAKEDAGQARLVSPTVKVTSPHCLAFYYHMTGRHIGFLNLTNIDSTDGRPLLSVYGAHTKDMWHKAKVTINVTSALTLQFLFTSQGIFSDTAIDDITVREGACDCSDDHQCPRSGECFDSIIRCDYIRHCLDNSDEVKCPCPNNDFRCSDGSCHPVDVICEDPSLHSCVTGNQTVDCKCNATTDRMCAEGFCYHREQECDGTENCPNGSDERPRCGEHCLANHVSCADLSKCIPNEFFCDGQDDCKDGSDEREGCVKISSSGAAQPDCSSSNYICKDQSQVLLRTQYCDGKADCNDNSDEPITCECCPDKEFTCSSGSRCISRASVCDGTYDCPDFSDELSCNCSAGRIRCDKGLCVNNTRVCDGSLDCNDWTDETSCNCSATQMKCNNGRCVENSLKCNKRDDCLDNSDEYDCPCSSNEFKCEAKKDKRCIPVGWKCDGYKDCHNSTDEESCGACAEYSCRDRKCLPHSDVCDGRAQCAGGEDEAHCFSQLDNLVIRFKLSNGSSSRNYTLCYDGWKVEWGSRVCKELGYDHSLRTRIVPASQRLAPWGKLNSVAGKSLLSGVEEVKSCKTSLAVALECRSKACGESSKLRVSPYIVGGDIVNHSSDWPWMMPIYYGGKLAGAGVYVGGGWVVTAGHLARVQRLRDGARYTERRDTTPHLFQVGRSSLHRDRLSLLNVSKVLVHADFSNSPALRHDIALLKLSSQPSYPSICLEGGSKPDDHSLCYVAGWGSVDGNDKAVAILRETRMKVLPDVRCVTEWNADGLNIFYSSTMICAGGDDLPSTCYGDSGGPLMCMNKNTGRWILEGIVSFGERNCYRRRKPNVFTEVNFYRKWILEIIGS